MKTRAIIELVFAVTFSFAVFACYVSIEKGDMPTAYFAGLESAISFVGFMLASKIQKVSNQ